MAQEDAGPTQTAAQGHTCPSVFTLADRRFYSGSFVGAWAPLGAGAAAWDSVWALDLDFDRQNLRPLVIRARVLSGDQALPGIARKVFQDLYGRRGKIYLVLEGKFKKCLFWVLNVPSPAVSPWKKSHHVPSKA